ncbi:MAG: sugar transferase [Candidatus Pacebacteria bacterium]|jgi:lipopolysaccharide/colanic/teichoic acid biosynthesis glycosyltransferase|nr:sugar transferase [Candidatus Paceibacterota bacterium]MBT4004728.1 sugar transferase [Candidatus Paceibacterota bacterium]MBT6899281.1 sugar transferase [Candidatus Paceibacterota bacterium]MBT7184181.1 sugar transferase [Candidatus Paceibacterota bacterium]MBT7309987.1 sugar transferase [Candidatus Paceibacterota bacterium]
MEIHPHYHSLEKRLFDLVVAPVTLVTLTPIFLLINLVILLTAGWPIFYIQKRRGLNKKIFKIIKFRTMYVGSQNNQWRYQKDNLAPSPMYKNWTDPRFVGTGRLLSKTGLDELPQLLNIIRGEMSFVGPRPLPIHETEKLNNSWDFRYKVKPGVFSQWSLNNKRHNSLTEWKKLEKETLRQGGFTYEVKTIIKTLQHIIQ